MRGGDAVFHSHSILSLASLSIVCKALAPASDIFEASALPRGRQALDRVTAARRAPQEEDFRHLPTLFYDS